MKQKSTEKRANNNFLTSSEHEFAGFVALVSGLNPSKRLQKLSFHTGRGYNWRVKLGVSEVRAFFISAFEYMR